MTDGQGRLVGIVTDGDLRRALDGPAPLLGRTAGDVMTSGPRAVTPDTLAAEALRLMNERAITVLFVIDAHGAPAGILHIHDLLRVGIA